MNAAIPRLAIFCAFIAISITVAGCTGGGNQPSPTPTVTPVPTAATPTSVPGGNHGTPTPTILPSGTPAPTARPGNNSSTVTPTPSTSPTPKPVYNATTSDWGSDKDTYARGDTATGWVYVTNTGNTPITEVDFVLVIKRTVLFMPVEKTYNYNATGLNIQPGSRQKVQFSQTIPSEYSGVSTAGDYQMTATAMLAGTNIGSYSRNIKVV